MIGLVPLDTSFLSMAWRSGSRYAPWATTLSTGAPNLNEVRYVPLVIPNAVQIAEIAAEVTTAVASSSARLVIASAGADGRPATVAYCTASLATTATGKISEAPSALRLSPGRYYAALVAQGAAAATFRTIIGVPEMTEQPSLPTYFRCCYSSYGQTGVVSGAVGGVSMDANDAARVELLVS